MSNYCKISFLLVVGSLLGRETNSTSAINGALDVRIPTYDQEGRINWELRAKEVDAVQEGVYLAKEPMIFLLEDQKPATIARSNYGLFNTQKGVANGSGYLLVEGEGFEAIGKPWTFEEDRASATNRLAFSEHGKIGFEEEVDSYFGKANGVGASNPSSNTEENNSVYKDREPDFSKDFPTTAYGDKIYLDDLGDGKKRFLLEKDVLIKMKDLESNTSETGFTTISCDWAEILIGKDGNDSAFDSFGMISQIHALGKVELIQPMRKSSADELKWTEESAQVVLLGSAKVSHKKWGEAQGEKIIISEKNGRAEVIGGNEGRSRVLLPALNKIKSQ